MKFMQSVPTGVQWVVGVLVKFLDQVGTYQFSKVVVRRQVKVHILPYNLYFLTGYRLSLTSHVAELLTKEAFVEIVGCKSLLMTEAQVTRRQLI